MTPRVQCIDIIAIFEFYLVSFSFLLFSEVFMSSNFSHLYVPLNPSHFKGDGQGKELFAIHQQNTKNTSLVIIC